MDKTDPELDNEVIEIIHSIGIPCNIKGYLYIRMVVLLYIKCKENNISINSIYETLYTFIAKKYKVTYQRVERAIRHAIELSWHNCDPEIWNDVFGFNKESEYTPTISELLIKIADKVYSNTEA